MEQRDREHPRPRRKIALLSSIAFVAVFISGITGGILLLQQHKNPDLKQGQVAINQGKSLLYISTSTDRIDTLTMVRTSDGQQLWQYHTQGSIATGFYGDYTVTHGGKAIQVVNGVVYFADGTPRLDTTSFNLMALRASDGKPLWQHHLQAGFLNVIGMTAREISVEVGPDAHKITAADLSVQTYRTDSGTLEWQRRLTDMAGGGNPFIVGNLLYMFTRSFASSQQPEVVLSAFQPTSGQLLWQSKQWAFAPSPFLSVNGTLVIYSITSITGDLFTPPGNVKMRLMGLRESDGTLAWQTTVDPLANNPWSGELLTQSANGILYFATNTPDNSLDVHALRLADGLLLWKEHITNEKSFSLDLQLADGRVYMHTAATATTNHPSFYASLVVALQASNGSILWQQRINQPGLSQMAVGNGTNVFLRVGGRALYALHPGDGTIRWHYAFSADSADCGDCKLLVADEKAICATPFQGTPGSEQTVAFQQNNKRVLWSYRLNMYVYTIALGP